MNANDSKTSEAKPATETRCEECGCYDAQAIAGRLLCENCIINSGTCGPGGKDED